MQPKLSKKQADKVAKQKYGPLAAATNQPGQRDRHQRFGIVMVQPAGLEKNSLLVCLGYGQSYEKAFEMAQKNEVAIMAANRWATVQQDWKKFGEDPKGYIEKFRKEFNDYGRTE